MSKKIVIGAVVLTIATLFIFLYSASHKQVIAPTDLAEQQVQQKTSTESPNFEGKEEILQNALNLFIQKKQQGLDMESGPCLGIIADDWVLDIAHNPRQPIDDEPENQCQEYRDGKVNHFIELDPQGKIIRSQ